MKKHEWPGTHYRHISLEYVPVLRQFVYIVSPHIGTEGEFPGVVLCGLFHISLLIDVHRPKFIAPEYLAALASSLLAEENRPFAFFLDSVSDVWE